MPHDLLPLVVGLLFERPDGLLTRRPFATLIAVMGHQRSMCLVLVWLAGGCDASTLCTDDADCVSGWCDRGVCVSVSPPAPVPAAPISDAFGGRWDGADSPPLTFAAATEACRSVGARLPSASELDLIHLGGTLSLAEPLWTLTPAMGGRQVVLGDDGVTTSDRTALVPSRCYWPPPGGSRFFHCQGPVSERCVAFADLHIDATDRPALDFDGARFDCALANAGLPSVREVQEIAQGVGDDAPGWRDLNEGWRWTANRVYHQGLAVALWRDQGVSALEWSWSAAVVEDATPARGSASLPSVPQAFRCVGRRAAEAPLVADPSRVDCGEACFQSTVGRFLLTASSDGLDAAVSLTTAINYCELRGAVLPTSAEVAELVASDWPLPDGAVWTTDSVLDSEKLRRPLVVGADGQLLALPSAKHVVRCVWPGRRQQRVEPCGVGTMAALVAGETLCVPATPGSSCSTDGVCDALGGEYRDLWSNAWDATGRGPLSRAGAASRCKELGGRLPTASEVWRIRGSQPIPSLGKTHWQPDERVWVMTPWRASTRMIATDAVDAPVTMFRVYCSWPGVSAMMNLRLGVEK